MTEIKGSNNEAKQVEEREFVMERIFDAPRQLVWKAWTEPERLAHWWGPKGWTLPVCKLDFREGGVWHYCMQGPAGETSWGKAVYNEIVEPERIVYTDNFSDEEGNLVEGMPELHITVLFTEHEGKTKLTNRALFPSAESLKAIMAMGMEQGATETWDRLEDYVANA